MPQLITGTETLHAFCGTHQITGVCGHGGSSRESCDNPENTLSRPPPATVLVTNYPRIQHPYHSGIISFYPNNPSSSPQSFFPNSPSLDRCPPLPVAVRHPRSLPISAIMFDPTREPACVGYPSYPSHPQTQLGAPVTPCDLPI